MVNGHMTVDKTKPPVVGDWFIDKDIHEWLNHNLYHNEVGEPWAWTAAVTYIVPRLNIMRKYNGSKGTNHTTLGLAWRRRPALIVGCEDREGLR